MADTALLSEIERELSEIHVQAERLAGRLHAFGTVVERYGQDNDVEERNG